MSAITPFTGVRIETFCSVPVRVPMAITPFTGVRIETANKPERLLVLVGSPPSRGCGLKHALYRQANPWHIKSPPSRGCGLKPIHSL